VQTWNGGFQNGTLYVDDISVGATPGFKQAAAPSPKNGATLEGTWATLTWTPGVDAVSNNIYIGTNYDEVNEGAVNTFIGNITDNLQLIGIVGFPFPEGLQRGTTYYWRVDGINEADPESPWKGNIWSFWVPSQAAYNPTPVDGMKFIETIVLLEWSPGEDAAMHTVYFGTNPDDVANATSGGTDLSETTFNPGPLELETTYYWRVDEHAGLVQTKGEVWSFTTKREGGGLKAEYYDIGSSGTPSPPESAFSDPPVLTRIDPGINFEGASGTSPEPNVVSADGFAVIWTGEVEIPLTGTYTFIPRTADGVILLINGVENANMWRGQPPESAPGLPLEFIAGDIVSIEMWYFQSTSFGGDWTVRLDWESDRFPRHPIPAAACSPPFRASRSQPANGATDVNHTPILSWNAGLDAVQHDVYFGTDAAAVAAADASTADIYKGRQVETTFALPELPWNTIYYWRIDEVNDQNPESPWKGPVWSFITANYGFFEDFEIYNDVAIEEPDSMLVYNTWIDGFNIPANGSTMGYNIPYQPTMETSEVHGGLQSASMAYDNIGTATFSEVTRTLTPEQDWTAKNIQVLTLWFFGNTANTPGQLYVKINGLQVDYDGDAANLSLDQWHRWDIDLTTVGTNLQSVTSVAVGVQGIGATGTLFLDDMLLYPGDPLIAHWLFDDTLNDISGNGHDGTAMNGAGIVNDALVLDGSNQYVEVAHDPALNLTNAFTITALVQLNVNNDRRPIVTKEQNPNGSRGWNCWIQDGEPRMQLMDGVIWTDTADVGQSKLTVKSGATLDPGVQYHLAFVYDSTGPEKIYIDGVLQVSEDVVTGTLHENEQPVRIGAYIWDPTGYQKYLDGSISDLRIYNRVMNAVEITGIINGQ
jgi:hypothetical protein